MITITPEYLASQGLSPTFPKRFWTKVQKMDGCWLWTSSALQDGYGAIKTGVNNKIIRSNRAAWIITNGPIPNGLWILHNCPNGDNRACCNPDHLWIGTQQQNIEDAVKKGTHPHGESSGVSVLTVDQVREIRQAYICGVYGLKRLGKLYRVDPKTIQKIIRRDNWKSVTD
jgi:hypothetical protein